MLLAVSNARASASLVIAEIYGGGGNSGATYTNDYVVVFNPTDGPIDVTGWSIQYASSGGATWQVTPLATVSTMIAPGGYFLVQEAAGANAGISIGTPDASGTISMSATGGKVALCNSTTALTVACPSGDPSVVDFVGWGTSSLLNCYETAPAPATSNITSLQRKNSGCTDNDDNSTDFVTGSPNPRNSSSLTHPCGGGTGPLGIALQPVSVTTNAGGIATFTVAAMGAGPYTYQWHKAGFGDLYDDGRISGANLDTLVIGQAVKADEGDYSVTISNPLAETTNSESAHLTVNDPVMGVQPSSHTNVVGDIANVFASVYGTSPMDYQWYQNGNPVSIGDYTYSGPNNSFSANLTNVQAADQGSYYLVASNAYGAVTSSVATVTVFPTPTTRISRWDFNFSSLSPSEGIGAVTLLASNTASFATGSYSDPAQIDAPLYNSGWNTTGYPLAGTGDGTGGILFYSIDTTGYKNLMLTWEQRHSNTASKYARLQYSANGVDFVDGPVITMTATDNSYMFFSCDLSSVPTINDNPLFAFQIVTIFESTATGGGVSDYVGTAGNYGPNGTIRYDLVSVYGDPLGLVTPIPLHISYSGGFVTLTWSDPSFSLQAAPAATGTYTNVPGAVSGYTEAAGDAAKFYRVVYP